MDDLFSPATNPNPYVICTPDCDRALSYYAPKVASWDPLTSHQPDGGDGSTPPGCRFAAASTLRESLLLATDCYVQYIQ